MIRRTARWSRAGLLAAVAAVAVSPLAAQSVPRVKDSLRASPGKPQAPLAVEHRLSATPEIGRPLVVTITARAGHPVGALSVDVRGTDGVAVTAPVAVAAPSAGVQAWEVRVTPLAAGAARLNVLVSGAGDSGPIARSVVVPIDIGGRVQTAAPADTAGEGLIALPAAKRDGDPAGERNPR